MQLKEIGARPLPMCRSAYEGTVWSQADRAMYGVKERKTMSLRKKVALSREYFNMISDQYDDAYHLKRGSMNSSYDDIILYVRRKAATSILDVGCGTGELLRILSEIVPDAQLYGLDISEKMLEIAEKKLAGRARFILGDSSTIPLKPESCDVVCCNHSFHHYPKPLQVLEEFRRVLKADGILLIGENHLPLFERVKRNVYYALKGPCGDVKVYSEKEICRMLSRYFKDVQYKLLGEDCCLISAKK